MSYAEAWAAALLALYGFLVVGFICWAGYCLFTFDEDDDVE